PQRGIYKVWVQYQQAGKVIAAPFVLHVDAGAPKSAKAAIPANTINVRVTQQGFEPTQVEIPANRATAIAFTRDSAPNCGNEIVVPTLGIRATLPPGGTAVVQLPARPAGELRFACGMGMYRGTIVVVDWEGVR